MDVSILGKEADCRKESGGVNVATLHPSLLHFFGAFLGSPDNVPIKYCIHVVSGKGFIFAYHSNICPLVIEFISDLPTCPPGHCKSS